MALAGLACGRGGASDLWREGADAPEVAEDASGEVGADARVPCLVDPSSARVGVVAKGAGAHARAAVGPDGKVCIAHARSESGDLEMACGNPGLSGSLLRWTVTPLNARIDPSWFGRSLDIVFASDGVPVVFYRDADGQGLLAVRIENGTTVAKVVDGTPGVGLDVSATRGLDGRLRVAYLDLAAGALRMATERDDQWTVETVDTQGMAGNDPSLVVDTEGREHVTYFACVTLQVTGCFGELRYAKRAFDEWSIEVVDCGDDTGWYSSLVLDDHDIPHVAWHVHGLGQLRYATREAGTWRVEVVEHGPGAGEFASLALVDGLPVIACCDRRSDGLSVAVRSSAGSWSRTLIAGSGPGTSSSLVHLSDCSLLCAWRDPDGLFAAFF